VKLCLILLAGCALTQKSPPVTVRYYVPPLADGADSPASPSQRTSIRLARITAASHLGYSIAYRTSPVELQLYDLDRWTDTPDVYAKRALERALFRDKGFVQSSDGLSLDVDVLAFEELRSPPSARVELSYTLRDEDRVIASDTVTSIRRARSESRGDVVVAVGDALDRAADEIAMRVAVAVAHPVQPRTDDDVPRHRVTRRR
jgi:ABC-type uncharacterized transport system auxiliary subunit